MSPWKVILATMVIFVCGVVTGALVIKTLGPRPPMQRPGPSFGIPGQQPVIGFMRRLSPLGLTQDQSNQIAKIELSFQITNAAIVSNTMPLRRAEAKRAHNDISAVLTPEQRTLFNEMLAKDEQHGRGPRGDGMGRGRMGPDRFGSNGLFDDQHFRDGRGRHNPSTNSPTNAAPAITSTNFP